MLLSLRPKLSFICHRNHCRLIRLMATVSLADFKAVNEPVKTYIPGSQERKDLEAALKRYADKVEDIPIVIGDEEIRTADVKYQVKPFDHKKQIAKYYYADAALIQKAIDVSQKARKSWDRTPFEERAQVFLKAADLFSKTYRMDLMASTMLGQAKNIFQAEIDCVAELVDFYTFNTEFAYKATRYQPNSPDAGVTNSCIYRGCEGFWAAITPFNFTAIAGNLPAAPAIMGNTVVWKPSDTSMLSNWVVFKVLREAGLPPGVINFVPCNGPVFGDVITKSPHLAGINFTGSARTFKVLWKAVANNVDTYRTYPRLIGECGGKNFHFVHKSANVQNVVIGSIRSAFEYSGQKCSACSRAYIPESLWPQIKDGLIKVQKDIIVDDATNPETFVSAVIDDKSFARVKGWMDYIQSSPGVSVVAGGACDDSKGYFVQPTIVQCTDPMDKIMQEEIFAPIISVYVYPDDDYKAVAEMANNTSPYSLTGAIFADDQSALDELQDIFRDAAGNFYINDKSTGSVVGQQPFGGARLSGTNDKAGGPSYMMKFASIQSIKTSTVVPSDWRYPSMAV